MTGWSVRDALAGSQNRCSRCGPHLVLATDRADGSRVWSCGVAGCPCEAEGCRVLRRVEGGDTDAPS